MPQNLLDLDLAGLTAGSRIGEKPFRAPGVPLGASAGVADFAQMTDIAKSLREKTAAAGSGDGARRSTTPRSATARASGCSTSAGGGAASVQAGEMASKPCSFGRRPGTLWCRRRWGVRWSAPSARPGGGFNRNLTVAEIIGKLWVAQHSLKTEPNRTTGEIAERPVSNVVMMGMGEPLANFENVVTALGIMLDDHAYGLSRRRVTVSTSGLVPAMDRLAERCPVALAVSLHAPNDALRDQIVPINKKYPLHERWAALPALIWCTRRGFHHVRIRDAGWGRTIRPAHAAS